LIAAELTNSSADFGQLGPLVDAARRELHAAGIEQPPNVVLAAGGYWHQVQMQALAADGLTVLIPPDAKKREGSRPGWNGGLYAFMRRALATPAGAALYRRRSSMIEPVFADTKFNRKIDPLLTPRPSRLPLGMAAHQRHSQPPQAPPAPPHGRRRRLTERPRHLRRPPRSPRRPPAARR
jgi:hypothetical protein